MDGIAGVFVASYITAVLYNGNGQELIDKLKKESGFIKWLVAIVIVHSIKNVVGSNYYRLILGIIIIAFLLNTSKDFFNQINRVI